ATATGSTATGTTATTAVTATATVTTTVTTTTVASASAVAAAGVSSFGTIFYPDNTLTACVRIDGGNGQRGDVRIIGSSPQDFSWNGGDSPGDCDKHEQKLVFRGGGTGGSPGPTGARGPTGATGPT